MAKLKRAGWIQYDFNYMPDDSLLIKDLLIAAHEKLAVRINFLNIPSESNDIKIDKSKNMKKRIDVTINILIEFK
jgi:hypothetical protein